LMPWVATVTALIARDSASTARLKSLRSRS
jgi:hypothetical protein